MNNLFEAYTDGSCDNMNIYKAGGSAYVVLSDGIPIKESSKGFIGTTNNRMEQLAIISVINFLPCKSEVVIHTDSQYSIISFTFPVNKYTKNKDLISLFHRLSSDKQISYRLDWVKGHNGNEWNEYVDNLAYTAYRNICAERGIPCKHDETDNYNRMFLTPQSL